MRPFACLLLALVLFGPFAPDGPELPELVSVAIFNRINGPSTQKGIVVVDINTGAVEVNMPDRMTM